MSRKLKFLISFALLCLFIIFHVFSQTTENAEDANNRFITIFIKGYDPHPDGWDENPDHLFMGWYDATFDKLRNEYYDFTNVCQYLTSNGLSHDSNTFVKEIGDFESGSLYLDEAHRQPFISLAKCEWVYRNCSTIKESDDENTPDNEYEDNVKLLLKQGPRFLDLLLPSFDDQGNPISFQYFPELPQYSCQLVWKYVFEKTPALKNITFPNDDAKQDFIKDLYSLAKQCPDTTRFVAHSMGGIFIMRYLVEEDGYYKKYQEYSRQEYDTESVQTKYSTLKTACLNLGYEDTWIYENIFKKERQVSVDKVIILDSPIEGTPVALFWSGFVMQDLLSILTEEETFNSFTQEVKSSTTTNLLISIFKMLFSLFLDSPFENISNILADIGIFVLMDQMEWNSETNSVRLPGDVNLLTIA